MIAELVTIGDEILIGQIVNTNSVFLSKSLNSIGIAVSQITSISDKPTDIINTIERSRKTADVIIITGGLGPTSDDVTKHTLTSYFDDKLIWYPKIKKHIEDLFKNFISTPISDMNREQALLPSKAKIFKNEYGTASGMWFSSDDVEVIALPGVPYEMKFLMEKSILPQLKKSFNRPFIYNKTLMTYGLGESVIALRISDWESKLPDSVKLAYLPSLGRVRLRLSSSGMSEIKVREKVDKQVRSLRLLIEDIYVGDEDNGSIEVLIGKILFNKEKTLSIAESCTGGKISSAIVTNAGASKFFNGGIVAYTKRSKTSVLNVSNELIEDKGVVSSNVAEAMALGVKERFKSDYGLATTGNAGPKFGDKNSKIGQVYIAIAGPHGVLSESHQMGNHRERVINKTTNKALEMLYKLIKSD
ncbi:MAG: CinA family nicotinamide mononucleotide deamidase-related protein [Flavobacteriaceae bacterium]|nr:CinA family nicotinamide mononucleotide deamidase-related protein [Flavobacteriaceae bacterium]